MLTVKNAGDALIFNWTYFILHGCILYDVYTYICIDTRVELFAKVKAMKTFFDNGDLPCGRLYFHAPPQRSVSRKSSEQS